MDNELQLLEDIGIKIDEYKGEQGTLIKQLQEEVKELKAKGGRMPGFIKKALSTAENIAEIFQEKSNEIAALSNSGKVSYELKLKAVGTMTGAANLTGSVVASYGSPEVRPRAQLHLRDLVRVIASSTGLWKYYRQNTPAGEGSFAFQTTHGNTKAQLDYDLQEISIVCDYLAGFVVIAKQMLSDLPFLQTFVNQELVEDYLRTEDNLFFGQLYSAATGAAGTSTVTAERIIETIANLSENHFNPNYIVVTNPVWAKLLKTKPNDYSIPGGVIITPNGDVAIAGIPVVRTPESNLGVNKMLIGDFTKAAIIQAEDLNISMSEHDDQNFRKNLISVKAESRVNMGILNTSAFVYANAGTT